MIKIFTDSCFDVSDYISNDEIEILPLYYSFSGEDIEYGVDKKLTMKEYFKKIKEGKVPYTSSVNVEYAALKMKEEILKGNDIICIQMSSGLSSTYQNICMAKDLVMEEFPDAKITVFDALTSCMAQGLLVLKAYSLLQEGKSYEEIVKYIEDNKKYYQIKFFVGSLDYLQRGGRISKTESIVGTALGIRPLITVDKEGKAVQVLNSRGVKKCDNILLNYLKEEADKIEQIGVVHSDDIESAKRIEEKIQELNLFKSIIIGEISPVIASHIGPNAYGVAYKMKKIN